MFVDGVFFLYYVVLFGNVCYMKSFGEMVVLFVGVMFVMFVLLMILGLLFVCCEFVGKCVLFVLFMFLFVFLGVVVGFMVIMFVGC